MQKDHDALGFGGIILIKKKDPITRLYLSISRVNFSEIGFYYRRNPSDRRSYYLILIDVFSIPDITVREISFNEYIDRESIECIKYKKIRQLYDINVFISCIKDTSKLKTIHSKKELLLNFIKGTFFSFEIFNKIIQRIDTSIISAGNLNTFLLDSKCFELEADLKIPITKEPIITESVRQNFIVFAKNITDLILNHKDLSDDLIKIFNDTEVSNSNEVGISIKNYVESSKHFHDLIIKAIKTTKIRSEDFNKLFELVQHDFNKLTQPDQVSESIILDDKNKNSVLLIHDTAARMTATNNIKSMLNLISNDVKNDKIPVIRLNKLIHNFNVLMEKIDKDYHSIKLIDADTSTYALITTNDNVSMDIPVQLRNGSKLMIPMNETNYSRFTKEQLEEMLVILDIYSNGNSKFDQIRARITKELAIKTHNK